MHLTIIHNTGLFAVEVDESMSLRDLSALIELDCGVAVKNQRLVRNAQEVAGPDRSLGELGFGAKETLYVYDRSRPGDDLVAAKLVEQVESHRQQVLGNPRLMRELEQTHPEIAEAARNDPHAFRRHLTELQRQQIGAAKRQRAELERLQANPFDVEAQQRIEEMIRQENIMRNMEAALEHNPESFASVSMLYISVVVNQTPVKALVDSGAQASVMSRQCAEQCGIMRLVDSRFAGEARGVGRAKILGRVHNAQLRLGSQVLMCSFSVMEGAHIGLLFGLDMLKRHQMCIDLKRNVLAVGAEHIEFLPEHQIPKAEAEGAPMAAAPSSSQTPQTPQGHSEHAIKAVMDLGVPREHAVHLLDAANGDVNVAASMIFS
ncbi:DNA damage-inducible protein 1 [Coemansia sp. RSA 989]|nr:DNA damage-inducible protein 1 [Coemansia sp. RSA 1086]KAJ1749975.1 DNA damage-inducible protein 1 [Coemansia sp. RSA 1821]KAJ1862820.1 DNA damage-inducible protein 1 [Coemansia sp. RSA 989]KAJ1871954.1 DNA damage-inducible protein 1 [Coemansia sp. RSA 990]KAJ2628289.1 DNA damage-inducible protein 1 [Coemansia sp. RSA 1290]KAJ2649823.1 DNA damage-inducible protein 1 [Coemansia sp. RSA 1250]KAJ2672581.1 DNA damage-inducible protein 1 [Coemansia sp. RSA 1085]